MDREKKLSLREEYFEKEKEIKDSGPKLPRRQEDEEAVPGEGGDEEKKENQENESEDNENRERWGSW